MKCPARYGVKSCIISELEWDSPWNKVSVKELADIYGDLGRISGFNGCFSMKFVKSWFGPPAEYSLAFFTQCLVFLHLFVGKNIGQFFIS